MKQKSKKVLKKRAKTNSVEQHILLGVLIILFTLTFFCSLYFIGKYYGVGLPFEIIEVKNKKNKILITNNSDIEKDIRDNDFSNSKEDLIIENIDTIEFTPNKKLEKEEEFLFNVRYNILENTFSGMTIASNNSDILVRFAYSYDQNEWTYVNNVISTTESNLSPLMGNYYDIAGIVSNLKVGTNVKIASEPGKTVKMYWKSETVIKNTEQNIGKKIKANFKIEYDNN